MTTTIMQPFQCNLQPPFQEMQRTTHTGTTSRCKMQSTNRNDPSRTRRTQEAPFVAGCSHFTRKNASFVLRFPPQFKAHATFMRPLQCVLQRHVANLHLPTNMEAPDDNNHAAIPMRSVTTNSGNAKNYAHRKKTTRCRTQRTNQNDPSRTRRTQEVLSLPAAATLHGKMQGFVLRFHSLITKPMQHSCGHHNTFCSITWLTCISLPTWQHQMTTILQPFQCDLQPQIKETQRTTHTGKPLRLQNTEDEPKRPQPHPPHTGGTFHCRPQPFYMEKCKVSCSGFHPRVVHLSTWSQGFPPENGLNP